MASKKIPSTFIYNNLKKLEKPVFEHDLRVKA